MKRGIGIILGMCLAGVALAQAPFTIVRPADGSKVREKVRVLIPKGSIPDGGYVGIFVGGKFVEALVPNLSGQFHEYILDTKGRNIPDGNLNLEAVLYVDFNDAPRIIDRSSVQVSVQNSASIPVPANGFALRYKFNPATRLVYNVEQRISISTLTEAQNRLGARGSLLPIEAEKIRLMYAIDNAYPNGDGLIRIQALPNKNREYAVLTVDGEDQARMFMDFQMAPLYMRVNNVGREIFGSVPHGFPMEGTSGVGYREDLYVVAPLPVLPTKRVKPGDTWQSRFQLGDLDLERSHEVKTIVETVGPARGEFVGLEWESGHPCAKLRTVLQAGARTTEGKQLTALGRTFSDEKLAIEETIWFALDKGIIVRSVFDITIDAKQEMQGGFGGRGGAPMGGGAPGGGRPGLPGGRPPGGADDIYLQQGGLQPPPRGGGGQRGPGGPAGMGMPGGQMPGGPGGMGPGNAPAQNQFVRLRINRTMTLEK